MRSVLSAILLALSAKVIAAPSTLQFNGYAYDLATGRFLYAEIHEQKIESQRWLGGTITYLAPDGVVIGTKTTNFSLDPFIPVFQLELNAGGRYVEGISAVSSDTVSMYRKRYKDDVAQVENISRPPSTAADSGFHSFVWAHFTELLAGKKLRLSLAVASNLDVYKFRMERIEDGIFENKPVVRFRVQPDSLLRLLVDSLELSYDADTRQLLEYHGMSNLHNPATGDAYNVRVIYPTKPPADVPAAASKLR